VPSREALRDEVLLVHSEEVIEAIEKTKTFTGMIVVPFCFKKK
jgi:hypothetical protein